MNAATITNKSTFYWSVRRELWENRSLYFAPIIVAVVEIIGFAISAVGLPERRRVVLLLNDPVKQRHLIEQPYDLAAVMMLLTIFFVGIFYCLDALYGERRDRSILFWKSLPASDLATVLSKISIALLVLPLIGFCLVVLIQLATLVITSVSLLFAGGSVSSTWKLIPFFQNWFVLLYGLIAVSLWNAPIYGWMLLVSAYVRRAAFLWAILPWFAISVFERITFGSSYFFGLVKVRCFGFAAEAFDFKGPHPIIDSLDQLTPLRYLTGIELWLGLLFAAACLAGAVQLRRYRGPI